MPPISLALFLGSPLAAVEDKDLRIMYSITSCLKCVESCFEYYGDITSVTSAPGFPQPVGIRLKHLSLDFHLPGHRKIEGVRRIQEYRKCVPQAYAAFKASRRKAPRCGIIEGLKQP
jgi:alkylated DNA nucleotide flippase Atl1